MNTALRGALAISAAPVAQKSPATPFEQNDPELAIPSWIILAKRVWERGRGEGSIETIIFLQAAAGDLWRNTWLKGSATPTDASSSE